MTSFTWSIFPARSPIGNHPSRAASYDHSPQLSTIRERVKRIETTPSIPAVFLPLLELLNAPPEDVKLEEVVKLVSYDNTIAAQCLRVASSPLFGLAKITGIHQGSRDHAWDYAGSRPSFSPVAWATPSLRKTGLWIRASSGGILWVAPWYAGNSAKRWARTTATRPIWPGLLHDIGFMVNCMAFPEEFATAVKQALREQIPLDQAERATMGFTHCETRARLGREMAPRRPIWSR